MEQEVDGIIDNVEIITYSDGKTGVYGNLVGDYKGRFASGMPIRTSWIVSGPDENGIVKTRNSVYKVILKDV